MSIRWLFISMLAFSCPLAAQGPLTLDRAVAEALQKHMGLLAEKANISIAEAQIITARLRPNPVLSVSANHLDALGTGFNDSNGGGPSEVTVHTDFTLEHRGKRDARIGVARQSRSVVELQFEDTLRGAVLAVQNAFVDALLAQTSLKLAQDNAGSLNQIVEVNSARLKAGDIAEVELVRSQLAALQSENEVSQATLRLRTALTALQVAIGRRTPAPGFSIQGELRRDETLPLGEEVRRLALSQRPDLRALAADVERARLEVVSQQSQAKVDYTVGTEYTRQMHTAQANALGFTFAVPLPVANRNQGEIERARAEQRQAELRRLALEGAIAGEVETAYEQYTTARALLERIEKRMLTHARDVREITEFSYRRGDSSLLELLDAQRAFNETMQAYNEARAEYARSLYLLDSVSGKVVVQ